MSRSSRIVRRLASGALALVIALPTGLASAGEVVVDHFSTTTLVVEPGDRTLPGVELTLTATVDGGEKAVAGEEVMFTMAGEPLGTVVLDGAGQARITARPRIPGVHVLVARFRGTGDLVGSSDQILHSVLPLRCPDQATPGAGAVVRHAYLSVLGRCPDPAGFAYWTARLDGGGSATAMARALASSVEGIGVVVDGAYERVLERPADAGGREVWAAKVRAGWPTSRLWAALAASPEFVAGVRDTVVINALVDRAFRRLVGRVADEGSRDYWHARFSSGASRSAALRALVLTPEALGGIVRHTYLEAIGRLASPVEQAATQARIKARGGDWRLLGAELLGWSEAATIAQRYPDYGYG